MDSYIALTDVLTLRRHEKDFLLRKEERYIRQFNTLANRLIRSMQEKKHTLTTDVLQRYQRAFNQLTELNYEIGITPTDGLLGSLNTQTKLISGSLGQLTLLSNERKDEVIEQSAVSFSIISFLLIIFSTILTYYTSTRLARPINRIP